MSRRWRNHVSSGLVRRRTRVRRQNARTYRTAPFDLVSHPIEVRVTSTGCQPDPKPSRNESKRSPSILVPRKKKDSCDKEACSHLPCTNPEDTRQRGIHTGLQVSQGTTSRRKRSEESTRGERSWNVSEAGKRSMQRARFRSSSDGRTHATVRAREGWERERERRSPPSPSWTAWIVGNRTIHGCRQRGVRAGRPPEGGRNPSLSLPEEEDEERDEGFLCVENLVDLIPSVSSPSLDPFHGHVPMRISPGNERPGDPVPPSPPRRGEGLRGVGGQGETRREESDVPHFPTSFPRRCHARTCEVPLRQVRERASGNVTNIGFSWTSRSSFVFRLGCSLRSTCCTAIAFVAWVSRSETLGWREHDVRFSSSGRGRNGVGRTCPREGKGIEPRLFPRGMREDRFFLDVLRLELLESGMERRDSIPEVFRMFPRRADGGSIRTRVAKGA